MDKCPRCKEELYLHSDYLGIHRTCRNGCFTGFESTECFNFNRMFKLLQNTMIRNGTAK